MSNTALWDRLGRTDPAHTKRFKRAGGFEGTAIQPIWSFRRMTEEFGPCGTGWGVGEPSFQVVPGDNREVLVYCTTSIWYRDGDAEKTVWGVGGDKIVTHIKANEKYKRPERWENDDEAFKKAFTDATTNALKLIGVGADVHMGLFDDSKYVNDIGAEFEEAKRTSSAQLRRDGVWEAMEQELLDATTLRDVNVIADTWKSIAARDGWPRDWKEQAAERFKQARADMQARDEAQTDGDAFPGDFPPMENLGVPGLKNGKPDYATETRGK